MRSGRIDLNPGLEAGRLYRATTAIANTQGNDTVDEARAF